MYLRKPVIGSLPVSLGALAISALTLVSCTGGASGGGTPTGTGGGTGGGTPNEFIATLGDLSSYKTWEVADYTIGKSNPALGSAHMGTDNAFSRRTYKNSAAKIAGGEYPIGSIVVKETFTWENGVKKFPATGGVFAMAKRGKTFNSAGGGWEWFELSPDGSQIVGRGGAEMMNGMCNACHTSAATQTGGGDMVFPHRSEMAASVADFANYSTWDKIEETSASNPWLGGFHKGSDPTAVRRVYKKQLWANPDTTQSGYPIGTIIVKEVRQNSLVTEITAMVKRGGAFNAANNGWEWFMLDPSTSGIAGRGADLMGGACNSCHGLAKTPANGADYVFKHAMDPFNK